MSHDPRSEEWTAAEREIFRDLPREKEPPPGLEERLVKELRRRGRLAPTKSRWIRPLLQTAAAVLLLIGGVFLGRWTEGAAGPEPGARFLLLLYEPPGWSREAEAEAERVEEYGAWARRLVEEGRSVTGAPLGAETRVLGPEPGERDIAAAPEWEPEGLSLGGYFLIGAADFDGAVDVAESCPHLRHGGTVVVRALALEP